MLALLCRKHYIEVGHSNADSSVKVRKIMYISTRVHLIHKACDGHSYIFEFEVKTRPCMQVA